MNHLRILGIRGVPAAHGGFETFAEYLAVYLHKKAWNVTVYCQHEGTGEIYEDSWQDIKRVNIPVKGDGPLSTIVFDLKANWHAAKSKDLCLTLGYNTAIFAALLRIKGIKNVMNMDGIEWKRQKWGGLAKFWFWLNDWAGCWLANHLVADHPKIKEHLSTRVQPEKVTTIAYGAEKISSADINALDKYDLKPKEYAVLIARAEPENSILEVVQAWSEKPRGKKLVILGKYLDSHEYQRQVKAAASSEVLFIGAVYEKSIVSALRYYAMFYVHGHQVGGTNPSLVESLGAGNAILAHDNPYNRWVCGQGAIFFDGKQACEIQIERLIADDLVQQKLAQESEKRFDESFRWEFILRDYEALLSRPEFNN
jgi:glycosyltransferase involved in cell wall biosynthesis